MIEKYAATGIRLPNKKLGSGPLDRCVAARQISRAAAALGLHHITPHGYRTFSATKRRSDGLTDEKIAFELGQKTVAVLRHHYADAPDNWEGGKEISWLPDKGAPAWKPWLPAGRSKSSEETDFFLTQNPSRRAGSKKIKLQNRSENIGAGGGT